MTKKAHWRRAFEKEPCHGGPRGKFLALRKRRCQVPGLHPSGANQRVFPGRSRLNIRAENGPPGKWSCVELCGRQHIRERGDGRTADEVQTMNNGVAIKKESSSPARCREKDEGAGQPRLGGSGTASRENL